uniref:HTH_Tnp_Tc3_1 domain-containing protein n=1 Tax=Heterorhabditis bacteriophora TaxID=37862 RepID=A0A1I7XC92_HETBA
MPSVDQFRKPKMACGSLLDDIEKGKILPFPDVGLNRTKIAREIGRSRNVVANFLIAPDEYGSKKSGRRSSKVRNGEKRITIMKSNTTASVDEVRSIYCSTRNNGL